nr:TNFRSF17 isoform 2 [Scyliorhinus canicula]
MASKCRKASYYDGPTGACEPCGLRCNNLQSRPRMCEDYICDKVPSDRNVVASSIKEDHLAEDVEKFPFVRNQQFEPPVACEGNCISRKNEITKLMIGAQRNCDCDTSLPLPATEEGATILVTTKTVELCGNH